jgi:hypothetical protein
MSIFATEAGESMPTSGATTTRLPANQRRLQLDTRNCRIGAKNQRSRALGLIDAGRTAPPRARQSVLSACADSMYRGMGCVVLLTTCDRSQYRLTADLSVAVVRTAVSNGMHRAREAQADQSIARVRSREGF